MIEYLVGAITGAAVCFTLLISDSHVQDKELILHHVAHYDTTTGVMVWNDNNKSVLLHSKM